MQNVGSAGTILVGSGEALLIKREEMGGRASD